MRLEDAVDEVQVLHVGAALVVDDHVEALGPVRFLVDGVEVLGAGVGVVGDRPLDVGPAGDALGEEVLLLGIVVAAAAEDEQGANRLCLLGPAGRNKGNKCRGQGAKSPPARKPGVVIASCLFSSKGSRMRVRCRRLNSTPAATRDKRFS